MKYFLLSLILVLSACSLDKNSSFWNEDPTKKYLEKKNLSKILKKNENSTFWNEDSTKKSLEKKNLSKILKKNENFKKMTFEEFNLFLKSYSERTDYPDIDN